MIRVNRRTREIVMRLVTENKGMPFRLDTIIIQLSAILLIVYPLAGFGQLDAGPNDTINPGVPVTLTASYGLLGSGVTIDDNGVEGPFPIGFSFKFFGNIYEQFYVGANGWISFSPNPNAKGIRNAFAIPNAADYTPKNCILGPFQDLNPLQAGGPFIFYRTIRMDSIDRLVVMWCETPLYSNACRDSLVTMQIVLNNFDGSIENHLMSKPSCPEWNDNLATMGVQNESGYIGYAVPGRNATSWTARMEGWQYMPTSVDSFEISSIPYALYPIVPGEKILYQWFRDGELISSEQQVVVTPTETTTYHLQATLCAGEQFMDSITVYVIPYIPNAFTPNGDGLNDVFRITGLPPESITAFNLQIFDRWGQAIFTSQDVEEGWDGTIGGEACPAGVYVWAIWYRNEGRHEVTNRGTITLVR